MLRLAAATFAVLSLASGAIAQVVTITKIADFATAAPGGTATFAGFGAAAIDGPTAVFSATAGGSSAIYSSTGGVLSTLVPAGASIPSGTGSFTGYGAIGYQNGALTFDGTGAGQSGIYSANGTTVSRLVDLSTAIPGGTGYFSLFTGTPLSNGAIAFNGSDSTQSQGGIYVSTGGTPAAISVVADQNTLVPGEVGAKFSSTQFGPAAISGQTVVFVGGDGFNSGIYERVGNGPLTTIADKNTPLPNGAGNFTRSFWNSISTSGANVAFVNGASGPVGVYAQLNGSLRTIADTSTASPNGTGNFTGLPLNGVVPIDGDEIAFVGDTAASQGVYLYDGSALCVLIDDTDPVFDGKVLYRNQPFSLGPESISGNQVIFTAEFGNSSGNGDFNVPTSSGLYLATFTPLPEPSTLALVGLGLLALFRRRNLVRRSAA